MHVKRQFGFTLIELLVVVLIIGILAAMALPSYRRAVLQTRVMTLLPLLRSISDAQNRFYMAHGRYSLTFSNLDISLPAGGEVSVMAGHEFMIYHDYRCMLGYWGSSYSCYCGSLAKDAPQLEKYFNKTNFICWAKPDNDVQISVCQNISGKEGRLGLNGNYGFDFP